MKPFVEPEIKTPYEGVRSLVYELGDENETILMVSEVEPYTEVPVHQHEDVQIGLVLEGAMEIVIEGVSSQLTALQDAYWVPSNVPHSAKNTTSNVIRTLDIKRRKTALDDARVTPCSKETRLIKVASDRSIKSEIGLSFFVGPWFEIMFSDLSPGAVMPRHSHRGVQIGLGMTGNYKMEVDGFEQQFKRNSVYFADENVPHSAVNESGANATSLNIFIPPRWNLLPKKQRELEL
ncbi:MULTISPECIES: cupin domain-containing protein [unclassified Marinobacter]|uniref:cupin domain-containing protein n=1 Tax=unclassified Marinobacter TaxID=83889 RepID=UPI001267E515|nr:MULTISPECIES: cupin domain-containing protein [unclassified Marinobacter]QFS86451.1 Bacilysin biosynthesis protein BacB [Marinobacter sp. THAF197a]QFT50234.1 Bacilysin biosynthesis protein BacB [Marinobacter sp. THAF39]